MCIVVWGRCGVSWRAVVAFLCRGGVGSTLRGSLSILCVALTCRLHFACVVEHSVCCRSHSVLTGVRLGRQPLQETKLNQIVFTRPFG